MGHLETIIDVAKEQAGYVANYQVDVSRQMFSHYESQDKLERVQRGIYRVSYFPVSEEEQLIVAYLWSREQGVISHETALAIHDLSDVLSTGVHLCFPPDESPPRDMPEWVTLHRADVAARERQWHDAVQVTTIQRTLIDLAAAGFDPDLFEQALDEAHARSLVPRDFDRRILRELMTRRRDG